MNSSNRFALLYRPQSQPLLISNRKLLRIQFHKLLFSPSTMLLFSRSFLLFDPLKLLNLVPTTLIHPKIGCARSQKHRLQKSNLSRPNFRNNQKMLSKSSSQTFSKNRQFAAFPSVWRNSIVSPVHKKGSKSDSSTTNPCQFFA